MNDDEIVYFTNITDFEYHPLEQKLEKGLGKYDCRKTVIKPKIIIIDR